MNFSMIVFFSYLFFWKGSVYTRKSDVYINADKRPVLSPRYLLCIGHMSVPAAGQWDTQRMSDSQTHADPARLQHPDT